MSSAEPVVLFDAESTLLTGPLLGRIADGLALRLGVSRTRLRNLLEGLGPAEIGRGDVDAKSLAESLSDELDVKVTAAKVKAWVGHAVVYDPDGLERLAQWAGCERAAIVGGSAPGVPERIRADLRALLPAERQVYAHEADAALDSSEFYGAAAQALMTEPDRLILYSRDPARREAATQAGCQAVAALEAPPEDGGGDAEPDAESAGD